MSYKVIKNFLDVDFLDEINNLILDIDFPWRRKGYKFNEDATDSLYFNHCFFNNMNATSSAYETIIIPILDKLKPKKLIRVKLNCYTKKEKHIQTAYHTDLEYPHKVALFSLNTCNGYTYFKKSKKKVYSVENNCVLFNGLLEHCSANQTDENLRINININYT